MKLLVTGGAGYVGSVVTARLLEAGHEVTVLDLLSAGHRDAVPPGATLVEGDVRDRALVERLVSDSDAVIHMAALRITACAADRGDGRGRVLVRTASVNGATHHDRQGASAASLLRRLELAHQRIKQLTDDNRRLRDQLARAHGQRRAERQTGPTRVRSTPGTIGPCS